VDVKEYIDLKLVHEIHTSERRSFRACRRRWDWLFRHNYYPIVTAKPLEFGVAYHKAMETYYAPATWDWDREVIGAQAIIDFVEVCQEQRKKFLSQSSVPFLEDEVQQDYDERVELGRGMLKYYFEHVAPREDVNWKPVKVEIAFMVAIPNPETGEEAIWCNCDLCWEKMVKYSDDHPELPITFFPPNKGAFKGLPVVYAGRLDMLAIDGNGNYWIFDWKTARSIADNYEFLYLDDQIGSYCWALTKLGINVVGFVYHEQRKGYPLPPKENVNRRLGRLYSVAKNQDTDYDTYLRTVKENDTEAYESGLYDEFLEFLGNEGITYFARHQIIKSIPELLEIEEGIGMEALDMIDPKLRIYKSAGRFGCNFCAFRQPCMEKNGGGDYQYALDTMYEVRIPYYVRQEQGASTESKGGE
jgi:hypothetical protein